MVYIPSQFFSPILPKEGADEREAAHGDALGYLALTIEGKQWIANLYSHVFTIEHARLRLGPHVGTKGGERA